TLGHVAREIHAVVREMGGELDRRSLAELRQPTVGATGAGAGVAAAVGDAGAVFWRAGRSGPAAVGRRADRVMATSRRALLRPSAEYDSAVGRVKRAAAAASPRA
ncbi:MAG: hypothetical protein LDL26_05475, partial [Caenispirillum bisanense]|nr:hypothetical protein [Caenispirillum bisanense]